MDYTGLYARKYRVNRKLTEEERSNRFRQKVRVNVTPFHNLSIIRMNSTYLECVDRWFRCRGWMTVVSLLFFALTVALVVGPLYMFPPVHWIPSRSDLHLMLLAMPAMVPLWLLLSWALFKESFRWTHFPIRFNHRKRLVYVFRTDGTVLQAKWDRIFFTLGRCQRISGRQNWDIRGHVLDRDGETVLETFALPGDSSHIDELKSVWEFIRRYMEEGPSSVHRDVYWCHDIADKRERYAAGLKYLVFPAGFYVCLKVLLIVLFPMFFAESLGRWFAMRTSKIPVWPAEVEAQCAVDAFDPYRRDASHNPQKIPKETIRNG